MRTTALAVIALISAGQLSAQDSTAVKPDSGATTSVHLYRDPHKARVLASVFPGAGYFYTGEYLRSYGTYVVTIGGLGMGPVIFMSNSCTFAFFSACDPGPTWPYKLAGITLVAEGAWAWVQSVRDARHAAARANTRHDALDPRVKPVLEPMRSGTGGVNAGFSVRW
jgi:hypothetical protein